MSPPKEPQITGTPTDAGPVDLHSGEKIEARFTPQFRLFLLRYAVITGLTAILFGAFPGLPFSLSERLIIALCLLLAWSFGFDDWRDWYARRNDLWMLTNHRLIFVNPDENVAVGWLELQQIVSVKRFLWWSVRIRAENGQTTVMRYVGPTSDIQKKLRRSVQGGSDG